MKKNLRISFNGKTYDVVAEILDDDQSAFGSGSAAPAVTVAAAAAAPRSPTAAPPPRPTAGAGQLPSPLAGKVVSIDAKVGTRVKAGEPVITLEAMKMNTVVSSVADGVVTQVHVSPGDAVEEGQLLITLG